MIIVSTTGYYISILGPYLSNTKNNDASILNHIFAHKVEEIKDWVNENDVFVVDRGFRDSLSLLEDLGIQAEMSPFFCPVVYVSCQWKRQTVRKRDILTFVALSCRSLSPRHAKT